jgi:oligopeptide transport system substrate-binding protein
LFVRIVLLASLVTGLTACSELERPKTEPFYAATAPPQKKEFRWTNGPAPKSLDPARAAAAPETDVVRALFEGLTDTDPETLAVRPAIALEWNVSEDRLVWTFKLRKDAKWSNGERVTASDFVRSWKRLADLGDRVAHRRLLGNIRGMNVAPSAEFSSDPVDQAVEASPAGASSVVRQPGNSNLSAANQTDRQPAPELPETQPSPKLPAVPFGVEAPDAATLRVTLVRPDPDFPSLVSHPIFRPVFGDGKAYETERPDAGIITNGAFRIASIGQDGITLDRSDIFWGRDEIELERVRFVPKENAEKALEAYRAGEVEAVTNAAFEPLALKLLKPYEDFRQSSHGAVNIYEFNRAKVPFDRLEVREALAIAIERERLAEDVLDGAMRPALTFLPFGDDSRPAIKQDPERARELLERAGFPGGEGFPVVRLVINRNNVQQRVARAIAGMWSQQLGVKTEIVIREPAEMERVRSEGDFDLIRRGVVLPTVDEMSAMLTIFPPTEPVPAHSEPSGVTSESSPEPKAAVGPSTSVAESPTPSADASRGADTEQGAAPSLPVPGESEALAEFLAIPIYFPTSYSLVKPYVSGFRINVIDAPSLKEVSIDTGWQPKPRNRESK